MICAVAVLALLVLACKGLRADETEDKAVRAIAKLGGSVSRDEKTKAKPVIAVNLIGTKVTDAGLKDLAALKSLRRLYLGDTPVTNAGLKELAALKSLQSLDLHGTQVTDAGLKELAALKSLRELDLHGTQVTDAGVKDLTALKSLQLLTVDGTQVTDTGLKELRNGLPNCLVNWTLVAP
jgi:Leucine-rich repeat (LRR) protein